MADNTSNNEYVFKLTADTSGFNEGLDTANTAFAETMRRMRASQKEWQDESKRTWSNYGKSVMESMSSISQASQQGTSIKAIQAQYQKAANAAKAFAATNAQVEKSLVKQGETMGTVIKKMTEGGLKTQMLATTKEGESVVTTLKTMTQQATKGFEDLASAEKKTADTAVKSFEATANAAQSSSSKLQEWYDKYKASAAATKLQAWYDKYRASASNDDGGQSLTDRLKAAWGDFTGVAKSLWSSFIGETKTTLNDVASAFGTLTDTAAAKWHRFTAPAGEFSEEADKLREKITDLKAKMDKLADTKVYSDDWKQLEADLEKAQNSLTKYEDKAARLDAQGVSHYSAAWRGVQYDIEKAKATVEDIKEAQGMLAKSHNDFSWGKDTDEYQAMDQQLLDYEQKLAEVSAEGVSRAAALGSAIGGAIVTGAKWGVTQFGKVMQAGFTNLGKGVKAAASGVKSLLSHFNLLKRETNSVSAIIKKAHQTFTSFKSMLITRLKRTFISYVFNDMKANFGSMAKLSEEFNTAISSMVNSCKALGAQIIAIAEPIIRVLSPVITQAIDLLTAAADKMAQFTARLTGNETYFKASKGQYDYAKALEETANKTSKANKKTKEYQNTVLGFDQLNKLNGKTDTDASSLTGITNAQLEKAQTQATAVNSIADRIWKALNARDFKAAGQAVGDGINAAFSWLRNVAGWDANSKKITDALSGVIDFVNGLSEGFDGTAAGEAIGDVMNTVIESFRLLTDPKDGVDFGAIGRNVGDTIVAALGKTNWRDAGKAIVQGLQAAVKYVNGIISTPGFFKKLGKSISDALGGMIEAFQPEDWANLIAGIFNGLGELLGNIFGDQTKFVQAGEKLGNTINLIFEQLKPEQITEGLNAFFQSVVTFASNLLGTLDWSIILPKIKEILTGLDWATMFEAVAIFASTGLPGLIMKAFKNPLVTGIGLVVGLIISELVTHWDDIKTWFAGVMEKVQAGCEKLRDIILWPFKLAWDYSWFIVIKIGEALDAAIAWVKTAWTNITDWVSTAWDNAKTWVGNAAEWLLDKLKSIPNGVITGLEWMVNKVVDGMNWMIDQLNKLNIDMPEWMGGGHIGFKIDRLDPVVLPRLAQGGIVGDGQVFVANEGGKAELIGSDGGQTAVVNNNQIISAVVQGVRDAVAEVMMTMSNNNGGDYDGDIVIMVDSEELARASARGQRKIDKRQSPTVSFA